MATQCTGALLWAWGASILGMWVTQPNMLGIVPSTQSFGVRGLHLAAPCEGMCTWQKGCAHQCSAQPCAHRRRDDGRTVTKIVGDKPITMNNRFVVPYNPALLRKYGAHVNVEVCASIK